MEETIYFHLWLADALPYNISMKTSSAINGRILLALACVWVFCTTITATSVLAQGTLDGEPDVMDRAVSDTDPMAATLRYNARGMTNVGTMSRVQTPGSTFGQQASVYIDPATGLSGRTRAYKLEGQGFTAYLNRPLYIVRKEEWETGKSRTDVAPKADRDGEWVSMIPPDTVYDLHPTPVVTPEQVMAQVAVAQLNQGQTNDEVGNIPSNPYFLPKAANQVELRRSTQLLPKTINTMVDAENVGSIYEMNPRPGTALAYEMQQKARLDQLNARKVFEARKEQWLQMRRELAEQRRAEQAEPQAMADESPEVIRQRIAELQRQVREEAAVGDR